MPYYVIGDDGQKYGPADVATLNQWIAENRLVRTQILEDEASGSRMAASAVAGLNFPSAPQGPAPGQAAGPLPGSPGYTGAYARPGGYVPDEGSGDLKIAWIMAGIALFCSLFGIVCCFTQPVAIVLGIIGIVYAGKADAKGTGATGPRVMSIIAIIVGIVWLIYAGVVAVRVAQKIQSDPNFQKSLQRSGSTAGSPFPQSNR